MKFSTRQDIDAPVASVFTAASDFSRFERQARRRGVELARLDELAQPAPGMRWQARFRFRNRERRLRAELVRLDPTDLLQLHAASTGVEAHFDVAFLPLSRNRTRIKVGLQILPRSLQARLLIQSMKFAKSNLDRRFAERVLRFAKDVELSHNPERALRPG